MMVLNKYRDEATNDQLHNHMSALFNYSRTESLVDYIQKLVPISRGMSVSVTGKTS
jgi:hypothetical protein